MRAPLPLRWGWPALAGASLLLATAELARAQQTNGDEQATLYVIRPADPGGGDMVGDLVFADDRLLGVTKGKSHLVAPLPAGRHTLWCMGGGASLELVPGQTYYLVCGFFHGFSLVDEEEGKALVAETKARPLATAAEQEDKKARRRREQYPGLQKSLADEGWLPPPLPAPPSPSDTAGMIQVPAYAPVELELMESVSSAVAKPGQRLQFRVASPARSGEREWLARGTPVEGSVIAVRAGARGGSPGVLAIDVPAIRITADAQLPLMGQMVSTARSRAKAALAAFAFGGLLGSSLVEGREMVYLAGEHFTFWTRDAAWVAPPAAGSGADDSAAGAAATSSVTAKIASPSVTSLAVHEQPPSIVIQLETPLELSAVEVVEVGDWRLPEPVRAQSLARTKEGSWTATFPGWGLLRYLPVGDRPIPLELRGTLSDGGSLVATGDVKWRGTP